MSSPHVVEGVAHGKHAVLVRTRNRIDKVSEVVRHSWTRLTEPPTVQQVAPLPPTVTSWESLVVHLSLRPPPDTSETPEVALQHVAVRLELSPSLSPELSALDGLQVCAGGAGASGSVVLPADAGDSAQTVDLDIFYTRSAEDPSLCTVTFDDVGLGDHTACKSNCACAALPLGQGAKVLMWVCVSVARLCGVAAFSGVDEVGNVQTNPVGVTWRVAQCEVS